MASAFGEQSNLWEGRGVKDGQGADLPCVGKATEAMRVRYRDTTRFDIALPHAQPVNFMGDR